MVTVSAAESEQLGSIARSRSLPHSLVRRARIVLMSAEGVSNQTIAARCGVSVPTISHWRRCRRERGVAGLHGELRPERPRSHDDEQVAALMRKVLHSRPPNATHWSVRTVAADTGISKSTVARYFALFGLQPHRSKSFKLSTDPFFVEKCATWWDFTSIHPTRRWCCAWTKSRKSKRWSAPSRCSRWGWDTSKE